MPSSPIRPSAILTLGGSTGDDAEALVFAQSSDRKGQFLAIKRQQVVPLLEGLASLRGKELLGETAGLASLRLSLGKDSVLHVRSEKGAWQFVQPAYPATPKVEPLLTARSVIV